MARMTPLGVRVLALKSRLPGAPPNGVRHVRGGRSVSRAISAAPHVGRIVRAGAAPTGEPSHHHWPRLAAYIEIDVDVEPALVVLDGVLVDPLRTLGELTGRDHEVLELGAGAGAGWERVARVPWVAEAEAFGQPTLSRALRHSRPSVVPRSTVPLPPTRTSPAGPGWARNSGPNSTLVTLHDG